MRIDIDKVLRERVPRQYRFIPRWLINRLADMICQDRLNELLERNASLVGADFAEAVVKDLSVSYDMRGYRPDPSRRRVILVSNHPSAGLTGWCSRQWPRRYMEVELCRQGLWSMICSILLNHCGRYFSV